MSKGVVIFGINNARVDYVKLAVIAASFVKKNMQCENICLITDESSKFQYESSNSDLMNYFSDVVILPETKIKFENKRKYKDTQYYYFEDTFKNESRSSIYDLSPYDETLLIDSDYLVCSDNLNLVWGSNEDILMNKNAIGLMHNKLHLNEQFLNPFGLKMYWATLIYFKKCEKAKLLFDLVEHVKDNWEFYKLTYDFPGHLFRNDYAFSIAIHILNGFIENDEYVKSFPDPSILSALDTDQLFKIENPTTLKFFANSQTETWKFYATQLKGINVHCMNKLSILNNADRILQVMNE